MRRNSRWRGTSLLAMASLLAAAACTGPDRDPPGSAPTAAPQRPAAAAVGGDKPTVAPGPVVIAPPAFDDASCAGCHAEVVRTYAASRKKRSFASVAEILSKLPLLGGSVPHALSKRHYEVVVEGGRIAVTRWAVDAAGTRAYPRTQQADFAIGSGADVVRFLWQSPSGELFEMPVAWYVGAARWEMAPRYDRPDHEDFDGAFTRDEMSRVNDLPPPAADGNALMLDSHLTADVPHGIGCARCHGAGGEHVRLAMSPQPDLERVRVAIVNPANLAHDAAEAVCLACHLEPTSRRKSLVRRFGEDEATFTPGALLGEFLVPVDFHDETTADRFELNHAAYRLRQSVCYIASAGSLGCTHCHDPHAGAGRGAAVQPDRGRCLTCHQPDGCGLPLGQGGRDAADNCITCHMPRRAAEDAPLAARTDHRIQRPQRSPRTAPADTPGGVARVYPVAGAPAGAEAEVYAGVARAIDGEPGAADALDATLRDWQGEGGRIPVEPVLQLGLARLHEGRIADGARLMRSILTTAPDHVAARLHLGAAEVAVRDDEAAIADLRQVVEDAPAIAEAHFHLGIALGRTGQEAEAAASLRRATELRPGYARAWLQLGNLRALLGDLDGAVAAFDASLGADPNLFEAYRGLGAAHRLRECWGEAAAALRAGLAAGDDSSELSLELALIHLEADDPSVRDVEAALTHAGRAMRTAPENSEAMLALALALAVDGRGEAAMAVGRQARRFGTTDVELTLLAAVVQHHSGDSAAGKVLYDEVVAGEAMTPPAAPPHRAGEVLRKLAAAAFAK